MESDVVHCLTKTIQSTVLSKQAQHKVPSSQPGWQDKERGGTEAGGEEEVLRIRESKIQLMYPFCQFLV